MGMIDWLFGKGRSPERPMSRAEAEDKTAKGSFGPMVRPSAAGVTASRAEWRLVLEGTQFPLFAAEAPFFDECRQSGQAALITPFSEFWPVSKRGYERKATGGGTRLLCASCLAEMAMSFQMSLPGGMAVGGMIAIGEGLPGNLFDAAFPDNTHGWAVGHSDDEEGGAETGLILVATEGSS